MVKFSVYLNGRVFVMRIHLHLAHMSEGTFDDVAAHLIRLKLEYAIITRRYTFHYHFD